MGWKSRVWDEGEMFLVGEVARGFKFEVFFSFKIVVLKFFFLVFVEVFVIGSYLFSFCVLEVV